jgi:integrase
VGERRDDPVELGKYRGKFCAVIGRGRQRKRVSLGTADPVLARTRLAEFRQQRERLDRPTRINVGSILDAYVAARKSEIADPDRPAYAAARLKPFFGHLLPDHITSNGCRDYLNQRRLEGVKTGTVHTELAALRAAVRWASKQQPPWIDRAPEIWMPSKPEPRERHLSKAEAAALVEACHAPHVRLFVLLALNTAGRAGAILGLKWDRVDLERRRITLRDPDKNVTRKGRAIVPVNETLFQALRIARPGAISEYVVEMAGHKVGSVKKGVAAAARRAGLQGVTPHVLRHTAAVWMAEAEIPMPQIAAFLGHSDSRITERVYARFSPDFLMNAARALEG